MAQVYLHGDNFADAWYVLQKTVINIKYRIIIIIILI